MKSMMPHGITGLERVNLHLSITVGQQYNAFEQSEVMQPSSSLPHLQKLTITLT